MPFQPRAYRHKLKDRPNVTSTQSTLSRQCQQYDQFLHRRPILVEIQDVVTVQRFNPNTGTTVPIRTGVAEILSATSQSSRNDKVRTLAAVPMYCDFDFYDVINNAQGTPRSRPKLVRPTMDFTQAVHKIPMYYRPW